MSDDFCFPPKNKSAVKDQDKLYGTGMYDTIRDAIAENTEYADINKEYIDRQAEAVFRALVRDGWAFERYR